MKYKITGAEIGLIQYVCECVAYDIKIDVNEAGVKLAERMSRITNNLIMSEDNQVTVNELPIKDISTQTFFIERK